MTNLESPQGVWGTAPGSAPGPEGPRQGDPRWRGVDHPRGQSTAGMQQGTYRSTRSTYLPDHTYLPDQQHYRWENPYSARPDDDTMRGFRNADTLNLIDPDAPARGLIRAAEAAEEERLLDADDRLALGVDEPATPAKGRVSWLAVLGVIFGVIGVLTALTGTLAPIALAAGAVGLFFSVAGFGATRKPYLASRPLAGLALLLSLGALALTAMVYSGQFDWLNRDDQVGWLRSWLDVRVPGLDRL